MHSKKGYILLELCIILTVVICISAISFKKSIDGLNLEANSLQIKDNISITDEEYRFIKKLNDFINGDEVLNEQLRDKNFNDYFSNYISFEEIDGISAKFEKNHVLMRSYKGNKAIVYYRYLQYSFDENNNFKLVILNRVTY